MKKIVSMAAAPLFLKPGTMKKRRAERKQQLYSNALQSELFIPIQHFGF
ncbi:MAG: hypothetical protein JST17_15605 [Bacteroidetes bacterium]|nr:hypothetical protein [Bacteroidota bacterium]MBS1930608.1 hypothetical protein [Bacteroidota bacterium]